MSEARLVRTQLSDRLLAYAPDLLEALQEAVEWAPEFSIRHQEWSNLIRLVHGDKLLVSDLKLFEEL